MNPFRRDPKTGSRPTSGAQRTTKLAHTRLSRRGGIARPTRLIAAASALLLPVAMGWPSITAQALQAPVGQGFTVTPSDLSYILKQIKIAERHVATLTPGHPCDTLVGPNPDQLASPLLAFGLRTVDGSCNNLQPGQATFGAADQLFPRLGSKQFKPAEDITASLPVGPLGPTSYAQKSGSVIDSQP
ncbi:MAG: hypothetical protein QOF35_516, partial [Actinomycetota bacterium]|nr:hypothetical protein [Actinomycetota bacterium]